LHQVGTSSLLIYMMHGHTYIKFPWFVVCPLSAGSVGGEGCTLRLYHWSRVADWLRLRGRTLIYCARRRHTEVRLERDTETRQKYWSRGNVEVCKWRYARTHTTQTCNLRDRLRKLQTMHCTTQCILATANVGNTTYV